MSYQAIKKKAIAQYEKLLKGSILRPCGIAIKWVKKCETWKEFHKSPDSDDWRSWAAINLIELTDNQRGEVLRGIMDKEERQYAAEYAPFFQTKRD